MTNQKKRHTPQKKQRQGDSPTGRKPRKDTGQQRLMPRDRFALTWIGQQYAMSFEHIRALLGRFPGPGATHDNQIGTGAAYDVIKRWIIAGWVLVERGHDTHPRWVWLTKKGLTCIGLTYPYYDLEKVSPRERKHLSAITAVRLHYDTGQADWLWISEHTLLQGTRRHKGRTLMHRPDAVLSLGELHLAIEVELSAKTESLLSHILVSLLRDGDYQGQAYYEYKAKVGAEKAQADMPNAWHLYTQVRYYAPPSIRKRLRRVRAQLVQQGHLSYDEAECIYILWYPLATTAEELAQEKQENRQ